MIIEEELARFLKWHRSLSVKPTVTAFRSHFEKIAAEELERHRGRFRPEDVAVAESLAHGIIQKLLHHPTTRLRNAEADGLDGAARLETVRDLFGIDEGGSDADRNTR
jgi:glutamyl-tRNA reductase